MFVTVKHELFVALKHEVFVAVKHELFVALKHELFVAVEIDAGTGVPAFIFEVGKKCFRPDQCRYFRNLADMDLPDQAGCAIFDRERILGWFLCPSMSPFVLL
ncbi:MAG: hypothetical protein K8F91_08500 [Candidatus Obscuribacterales bacterium]|nr:hypothetical protein [Candidatus Obscuribacterales bacterium]